MTNDGMLIAFGVLAVLWVVAAFAALVSTWFR